MNHWSWAGAYTALFVEALILTAALAPLTIRLARRLGFEAGRGERHLHAQPTTTLGGLSITGGFFGVVLLNLALARFFQPLFQENLPEIGRYLVNIPSISPQLAAILGGALAMHALGLADDKWALGPKIKLALMIAAALLLVLAGVRIRGFLPWPWVGAALTVAWVVFLTNSFNFLDNMDGLAAGVAAIAALAFGLVSFFAGEWLMAALYAVLAGNLIGFLFHNFHPARLFMGDNGSLFIGYLIGALSVHSTFYERGVPTHVPVLTPLIVLGVPIFDTVTVLWIRWRSGRPLMQGDRNHFSHRLLDLGMSQRRAVTFIYCITAAIALGAAPLRSVGRTGAAAILAQTALLFWVIHRLERAAKRRASSKTANDTKDNKDSNDKGQRG